MVISDKRILSFMIVKKDNLQWHNLLAVDKCEKSTSTAEHHHALVKLYSRATSQEIPAFFCEIKVEHARTYCQKENQIRS